MIFLLKSTKIEDLTPIVQLLATNKCPDNLEIILDGEGFLEKGDEYKEDIVPHTYGNNESQQDSLFVEVGGSEDNSFSNNNSFCFLESNERLCAYIRNTLIPAIGNATNAKNLEISFINYEIAGTTVTALANILQKGNCPTGLSIIIQGSIIQILPDWNLLPEMNDRFNKIAEALFSNTCPKNLSLFISTRAFSLSSFLFAIDKNLKNNKALPNGLSLNLNDYHDSHYDFNAAEFVNNLKDKNSSVNFNLTVNSMHSDYHRGNQYFQHDLTWREDFIGKEFALGFRFYTNEVPSEAINSFNTLNEKNDELRYLRSYVQQLQSTQHQYPAVQQVFGSSLAEKIVSYIDKQPTDVYANLNSKIGSKLKVHDKSTNKILYALNNNNSNNNNIVAVKNRANQHSKIENNTTATLIVKAAKRKFVPENTSNDQNNNNTSDNPQNVKSKRAR